MKIGEKYISENSEPFFIAEVGVNYYDIAKKENISLIEAAKKMIKSAAKGGASAVKFQTYKADKLAIRNSPAYWETNKEPTKTQHELFAKYDHFGEAEYTELAKYAEENAIIFMSTPFDEEAVEFLDKLMPAYKIASADITNIPLIRQIASKKKPILMSVGAADVDEILEAISIIEEQGIKDIALMHCVLNYPTSYVNANLLSIQKLRELFPHYVIGYSDHTIPDSEMLTLTAAYILGARVIEKHYTLDKCLPGNDHYHAMDISDMQRALRNLEFAKTILGKSEKNIQNEEMAIKYARRSIATLIDIPRGTKITKDMLICKRPGTGISPKYWDAFLGAKLRKDIKADEFITWEHIKEDFDSTQ